MNLTLYVWRQKNAATPGKMVRYTAEDVSPDMSFLEMLDALNEKLTKNGEDPIAFDHDCREGVCGSCGFMINGVPHGPQRGTTVCQLHMRNFRDGETLYLEPFRAKGFPMVRDLFVNRSAFDRIIQSGGYVSISTGSAPDGNALPIRKEVSDRALDTAACIGCGACVAACPNASASLFTGAKLNHLNILPQGLVERSERTRKMVVAMTENHFGHCTNTGECEAVCPKYITLEVIARMNRDYARASWVDK